MPLKIMVAATTRKANSHLPDCHLSNSGQKRLKIRANNTTNIERLLIMVETSDTGPLFSAQKYRTAPTGTNISLKISRAKVEFFRFILAN